LNHSQKKILFLSAGGRLGRNFLKHGPSEMFYGGKEFVKDGHNFEIIEIDGTEYKLCINKALRAINFYFDKFFGFPIGFLLYLFKKNLLKKFNKYDQIIVVTARFGLPLMFLKKFFKLKPVVTYVTMGLVNRDTSLLKVLVYRALLSKEVQISTLSESETLYVSQKLKTSVEFIPFGVDSNYWTPSENINNSSDYVLSVGNDPRRDYNLLISAWKKSYPKLVIISALPISSTKSNVEIIKGTWKGQELTDDEIKELYRNASFVIVPNKESQQPSGQSVTLQAMSCGKAVIYSNIEGLWDKAVMVHMDNLLLYKPGNFEALSEKIEYALSNNINLNKIGLSARKTIEQHYDVQSMADRILN
tara:strand:+ start:8128 stop:9207 length:1080 start_codon:yes stop_codon:yes gene_type:complete